MYVLPLAQAVSQASDAHGAERFARTFFYDHRVKKIVGSVLLASGLPFDSRDDLLQETFLVIQGYAKAGRVTNPDGIYSLVYATAFNSARTIRHQDAKNGANIALPPGDVDGDRQTHDIVDERSSADRGDAVDIIRARNMIARIVEDKLRGPMQTHPLISNAEPLVHVTKPTSEPTARKLSPEQEEIASIISSLGYKHEEFAADIGIGMSRLASYLYGRTATVPAEIMAKARELMKQAAPVVERWKKAYNKPMPVIIKKWESSLGMDADAKGNDDILAGILGVNPVTVYRWRKEDTEPSLHSRAKMDGRIKAELDRRVRLSPGRKARPGNK
jgi:hypothetical protein